MLKLLIEIYTSICHSVSTHIVDWIITSVITFFTVRAATKQFYYKNRVKISESIMRFGIESMLNLVYAEPLPDTAKVIFVEYGKRSLFLSRKQIKKLRKVGYAGRSIHPNLRKTIAVCGNSQMDISSYKPVDYGVLGAANRLEAIVAFDFKNGELYRFINGEIKAMDVTVKDDGYYLTIDSNTVKLASNTETERGVMIAVPIIKDFSGSPLLGGITFDLEPGNKTLYQKINPDDSDEEKKKKGETNKMVFQSAKTTADCLKTTYFQKKEM